MGNRLGPVENMERLKIAIDGSSGFVGANISKHFLELGYDVHSIVRNGANNWRLSAISKDITLHKLDITEREKVAKSIDKIKPDVFIHTAAYGGYHFESERERIFKVNLFGTMNVLDASIASKVGLFINTGSSSEYGLKKKPMKESDHINPYTDYAVSKALATGYCGFRNDTTTKNITFRLFSAYGYYEEGHRLIPYALRSAIKGKEMHLNNPNNVRDYIFIEDITSAYSSAVKRQSKIESGSVLNVGTGKQFTTRDVINEIKKITGNKIKAKFGGVSGRAGDSAKRWQADISKTSSKLKWKPINNLHSGLIKTKKWMEHNIELYENDKNGKLKRFGY